MIYMKVKGIFQTLPLESMSLEWICKLTNSSKEVVQKELDKLKDEKFITGSRKYKLKNVPQSIKDIPR